jgi:UDP-glucose 4-epimerase
MPTVEVIPALVTMKPVDERPNEDILRAYRQRKILITGGAGYLATNLALSLRQTQCGIVRLGREGSMFPAMEGTASVTNVLGDVRERAAWEEALQDVDFVFHFAAQTSVPVAERDPVADIQANVVPVMHLIEACRKMRIRPVVLFTSTVTVAGIPSRTPVDETHPDIPVTIYDIHKLIAEQYLKCSAQEGAIRTAILRLANVYGPGPKSSQADRGILNQMMRKALAGEPLTIYGRGEFVRDYVYVDDVVGAFLKAGACIDSLNGQHFVIGSGQGHTIAEAIGLVGARAALRTGKKTEIRHIDPPASLSPIESRNFVADISRFSGATGWKPSVMLQDGIDRTLEAYS